MIRKSRKFFFMNRVRKQIFCEEIFCNNLSFSIAVLDSGIAMHPDFERVLGFKDFVSGKKYPYDDCGHGTHVSGILSGSGKLSNGIYRGIVPMAPLIVGKVLDKEGNGSMEIMRKALIWVLEVREQYNIRILNISVGLNQSPDKALLAEVMKLLQNLWNQGIIVVCAVGNNGPEEGSISFLAENPDIISVGCHDGEYYRDFEGRCETYSGRGPGIYAIKKPDIVAPGSEIVSCNAFFIKTKQGYKNAYIRKSGTSMATPIVSGAMALAMQKFPNLSNTQLKRKLIYSATDLKEPWAKQGWGMVHVERLLT